MSGIITCKHDVILGGDCAECVKPLALTESQRLLVDPVLKSELTRCEGELARELNARAVPGARRQKLRKVAMLQTKIAGLKATLELLIDNSR